MDRGGWAKGARIAGAVLLCALLSGCMPFSLYPSGGDAGSSTGQNTAVPLTPAQSNDLSRQPYTLYFRYGDEPYLATEQRLLSSSGDKRIEKTLLQEMIRNGPGAGSVYLKPVINPNTAVVSVSENKEYLYVTLSSEFLDPVSAGVPAGWRDDPAWREAVYLERRLAVMAIVNALTELGQYSRVQILVDTGNTGQGERPTREMLGFASGDPAQDAQLMEPLARDPSMVLTPGNTMRLMMERFAGKDWPSVDELIARSDPLGYPKPSTEDVVGMLNMLNIGLLNFQVTGETVSNDGQSAVVTVSYTFQFKDGSTYSNSSAALRMVREGNIWKLAYSSVGQLLSNA